MTEPSSFTSEMITYPGTDGNVRAILAKPLSEGRYPAVVIVHELWGIVDYIRDVVTRLAGEGYVALAPNLYSCDHDLDSLMSETNVARFIEFRETLPRETPLSALKAEVDEKVGKMAPEEGRMVREIMDVFFGGKMPKERFIQELARAVEFLNSHRLVRRGSVGCIGFCLGGELAFGLATNRTELAACVSFYGGNPVPIESVSKIECPVLGLYGALDARVNKGLPEIVGAMARYGKDFQMRIYPNAPHAFDSDTHKGSYREEASVAAWKDTLKFLERTLP